MSRGSHVPAGEIWKQVGSTRCSGKEELTASIPYLEPLTRELTGVSENLIR